MKITNNPNSPCVRLAGLLLYQATERDVREMRLSVDGTFMDTRFDGQPQPAVNANLLPWVIKAFLNFAGVRLWPWTRRVSGKRLDFANASGMKSLWEMETKDIKKHLILRRMSG